MKILSPQEADRKKREQEDFAVQRAARLNDLIRQENWALSEAKERNSKEFAKLGHQFNEFSEEMHRRKSALESEVRELEERKIKALEPITALREEAQKRLDEAISLEQKLNQQVIANDERKRALDEEETKIAERKVDLVERQKKLAEDQKNIARTRQEADARAKEIEKVEAKLIEKRAIQEKEIQKELAELQLAKANVLAQWELAKKQEEENKIERIRLVDLQETIRLGFQELREKQQKQNA